MRSAAWVVRVIAVAAGVWGIYSACVLPFGCNREIGVLTQRSMAADAAPQPRSSEMADANLTRLRPLLETCGRNVNVYLLAASNAAIANRQEDAIALLTRALAVEERPEIYFARGESELALRRVADAERDFTTAADFNPAFADSLQGELRARVLAAVERQ
jgi:tetratricopeptide (TPR) repeat protein